MRIVGMLSIVFLTCLSERLPGQIPSGHGYGGHAAAGVQLLGIEPYETPFSDYGTAAPGEFAGRAVQIQYPLDNRAYEGPEPRSPTGFPLSTTGPAGGVPSSAGTAAFDPPVAGDSGWITLGPSIWESTWLARGSGGDALGVASNAFRARFEFPQARMFTVTPRFGWHLIDGPAATDLPGQLYDVSAETVLSLPLRDTFFMQAAVAPSMFTDGQNTTGDAFRLPARLLFFWTCSEQVTLSAGLLYLDRDDVGFLPVAGLIYKPTDDWKIELLMPRPRVAWRYSSVGDVSRWAYVVGEFGGGSWAIDRAAGGQDVVTMSDYRLLLGWEQTQPQGVGLRLEGGYVFNRSLEYTSDVGNLDLPATALVRFALTY